MIYDDVQICEITEGDKKISIIRGGINKPKSYMDKVVREYTRGELHNQFIEIFLDNPYVRIIVSGINDFQYVNLDTSIHHL